MSGPQSIRASPQAAEQVVLLADARAHFEPQILQTAVLRCLRSIASDTLVCFGSPRSETRT